VNTSAGWRSRIVGHAEVSPTELTANPRNWRKHPKAQQDALSDVLDRVGWVQDVIVNQRTGLLVDGHARLELALRRGEASVPVVYVDLAPDEETLVLATLDPLSAMAEADQEALDSLLSEVVADGALARMLDELVEVTKPKAGLTDPDDVPEPSEAPYVQRGEVYALGAHRLMCGDSTDAADVSRLLNGGQVDLVATDPPYAIYGSSTGIGSDIADDKMVRPFFEGILRLAVDSTKMFGHVYVCCDWRSWPSWWEMAKRVELTPKNLIVWDKGGAGLGSSYANTYELVGFFSRLPKQTVMTSSARTGQRQVHKSNIWRGNRVTTGREHNAQKPVELMEFLIENSSDDGDAILEPFSGSGTTIIAAERKNRRCFAMEIEPKYVQVAIERWEAFTGGKAERINAS
jgi:DNA modification methylase